ncbi:hypothetical protein BH09MYX1_BH09MYX1_50800 [soil metagenome]
MTGGCPPGPHLAQVGTLEPEVSSPPKERFSRHFAVFLKKRSRPAGCATLVVSLQRVNHMRFLPLGMLVLAAAACGGSTVTVPETDAGDAAAQDSAVNDSGKKSPCPAEPPTAGATCGGGGGLLPAFECEYGSSPNRTCNLIATCDDSGTWSVSSPAPGCGTKNPVKCPSTYASVPQGQSCSEAFPTDCTYPEGVCSCRPDSGPVPLDAAASATWRCDLPSDGTCPKPRPKLGSTCATPNQLCDYGACDLPGGTAMKCESGYWKLTDVPCPL